MMRLDIKKLHYDVNRETAKISTLASGKINKYEHPTFPLIKAK